MRLTHVRLLIHDYQSCFRFWRDVIGLVPVFGDESGTYAAFNSGTTRLSIFVAAEMAAVVPLQEPSPQAPDRSVVQRDVDKVDAVAGTLRVRGVSVTEPSDQPGWGIRVAHFRDPEGNLIELAQRLPDRRRSPAPPLGTCAASRHVYRPSCSARCTPRATARMRLRHAFDEGV